MKKHILDHINNRYMKLGTVQRPPYLEGKFRPEHHEGKVGKSIEGSCGTDAQYTEFIIPGNAPLSSKGELVCRVCKSYKRKFNDVNAKNILRVKAFAINAMRDHEAKCGKEPEQV